MVEEPTGWLSPPKRRGEIERENADLKRQLAEARAEYLSASKDAMELAGKLNAAEAERDRLAAAALDATRKCMAAWAAGEPAHRVKDMIDAVEKLQSLVDPLHDAALAGKE